MFSGKENSEQAPDLCLSLDAGADGNPVELEQDTGKKA